MRTTENKTANITTVRFILPDNIPGTYKDYKKKKEKQPKNNRVKNRIRPREISNIEYELSVLEYAASGTGRVFSVDIYLEKHMRRTHERDYEKKNNTSMATDVPNLSAAIRVSFYCTK